MKQFGIGLLTMTLGAVGTTGSRAQEVSYIIPTPKAELLQTASKAKLLAAANNGLKANYKTPVPLAKTLEPFRKETTPVVITCSSTRTSMGEHGCWLLPTRKQVM